jgi:hypothetical protein
MRGSRMMATGVVFLVLSVLLLAMNLTVGKGTPSALFWLLLLSGAILAGIGFARRILGSK